MYTNKSFCEILNPEERPIVSLVILLGISLLIKIVLIYQSDIINSDGIRFINSAHELFQGNPALALGHEKMLGFTFLLGLTHWLVPDWYLAGKILSCAALVMTTIPLYLITHQLFSRKAAFYTALVYNVAPTINDKCTSVIKDPLFLFVIVLCLWAMFYALNSSLWRHFLVPGLLSGLSLLIRPEGVVFIFVIILYLVVLIIFSEESRKSNVECLVAYCFFPLSGLLLVLIPFVSGMTGPETLSTMLGKLAHYFHKDLLRNYLGIHEHLKTVEETFPGGAFTHDFFEYASSNIYLIYLIGMLQTFCESMFPAFVLPLIFGLNLRKRMGREMILFLTVLASFLLLDYVFLMTRNFLSGRYLLVPIVLSYVLVGHGMNRLTTKLVAVKFPKTVIVLAVIMFVILPLGKTFKEVANERTEIKEAGTWLRDNRDMSELRLLVNEERVAFYAGLLRDDYQKYKKRDIKRLEELALQNDFNVLVLYQDKQDAEKLPVFRDFSLAEKFSGRKKVVMIYERKS